MCGTRSGKRAWNLLVYAFLLPLFPLLSLLNSTWAKCPMSDTSFKNGRIIHEKINDFDLTLAPEDYVLRFRCYANYKRIGAYKVICENGKWTPELPRCILQKCPKPPLIENGYYTVANRRLIGSLTHYHCNLGFEIVEENASSLICTLQNGVPLWYGEVPRCVKKTTCPDPGIPLQGSREGDCSFPGNVVQYACKSGYELVGEKEISCLVHGNWSADRPRCRPLTGHCPDPPNVANGTVEGNRIGDYYTPNEEAEVICNHGFAFHGISEIAMCMEILEWDIEFGECKAKPTCPDPGIPLQGSRGGDCCFSGNAVQYSCKSGYELIGEKQISCLAHGNWSADRPRCRLGTIPEAALNENTANQSAELENCDNAVTTVLSGETARSSQTKRLLDLNDAERLILYFIFDVSKNVRARNFYMSINFAKALVKRIGISQNGARAGALTFSSKAEFQFLPIHYTTTEDVLKALDEINCTSDEFAASSVWKLIRQEAIPLTREYVGRKGVKNVIFILTDGKAISDCNHVVEAKKLKEMHTEIYGIGITGSVKKTALDRLASEPIDKHVFLLSHYNTLDWLIQDIINGTIDYGKCGVGSEEFAKSKQLSRIRLVKAVEPWPWMAALYIRDDGPSEAILRCGGSIIGRKWILTAAHCLLNPQEPTLRDVSQVTIKLGLTDVKNFSHLQEFEAAKFFIHEKFSILTFDNDIALIHLNGLIEYNAYVRPICLPPKDISDDSILYKVGEDAFATGWGIVGEVSNGEMMKIQPSRYLKELRLALQSRDRCLRSILNSSGTDNMFTNKMLCAGTGEDTGDTCAGAAGGPLMQSQLNEDGSIFWTQIGVISWGIGCNVINTYGFYTHVHGELDWINKILNSEDE